MFHTSNKYFAKNKNNFVENSQNQCHTIGMKKPNTKSKSEGLRLSHEHWPMLRALIQARGRTWLEKWIERTYKKEMK